MEKYTRQVINLYKDVIKDITDGAETDYSRIFGTKRDLAVAATTARIKGEPAEPLEELYKDVEFIGRLV